MRKRPVNLYVLMQVDDNKLIPEYDRILAAKTKAVETRTHEISSLRSLIETLTANGAGIFDLDGFFYSYVIPQIGKEFDLIKIFGSNLLNIELKSTIYNRRMISDQLKRNTYYFRHLPLKTHLFTYVMSRRAFYALDGENIAEVPISRVIEVLVSMRGCETSDPDRLFKASYYLVSPVSEPEKFIARQYFLTPLQESIKHSVIKIINQKRRVCCISISGSAGTGKTLLIYDLARDLSKFGKSLVIHGALLSGGHIDLNRKISDFEIISAKDIDESFDSSAFDFIFVDEAQRIDTKLFERLLEAMRNFGKTLIFSADPKQILSKEEMACDICGKIAKLPDVRKFELTSKIRANPELSAFINKLQDLNRCEGKYSYENVNLLYARDLDAARTIIDYYHRRGYIYIDFPCDLPAAPRGRLRFAR